MKKILLGFFMGLAAVPLIDHLYNLANSYFSQRCTKMNIETNKMAEAAQGPEYKPPQIGFEIPSGEDYDDEEDYEDD